jgi:hypothetical protein
MDPQPLKTIHYERQSDQGVIRCRIEVFDDSAYIDGDEIEMIFELRPDSVAKAIAHVESLGYVRSG